MALADRRPLTPDVAQDIVVGTTPGGKDKFTGRAQDLFQLGIVDKQQAQAHKTAIQTSLSVLQYRIAQADIQTGPGVVVGDCVDSVLGSAQ